MKYHIHVHAVLYEISATNSNFIINKDFKYQFEFPQKTI
jgi:hypothetical protein